MKKAAPNEKFRATYKKTNLTILKLNHIPFSISYNH